MRERVIQPGPPVAALVAALVVVGGVFSAVAAPTVSGTPPADGKSAPAPTVGDAGRVAEGVALDPSAVIVGPSACPAPDAVWAELVNLVPLERLNQRLTATTVPQPAVQIIDLGVPYRVIAAGRVREYRDDVRDCAHRARVAAVFVALTFDPPVGVAPDAATPEPTAVSEPVVVATPESPRADHVVRVDVGGGGDAGLGPDGHIAQAGLAFRLAIGRGVWSLVFGTTASLPVDISVNGLRLRHWRLPAELGVRALFVSNSIEPYIEAGLGAGLLSERALELKTSSTSSAVELGAFATLGLRFAPSNRFAPFVAAHAELVPRPSAVEALPRGLVGHTPIVWVGGTAGVSIDFY